MKNKLFLKLAIFSGVVIYSYTSIFGIERFHKLNLQFLEGLIILGALCLTFFEFFSEFEKIKVKIFNFLATFVLLGTTIYEHDTFFMLIHCALYVGLMFSLFFLKSKSPNLNPQ